MKRLWAGIVVLSIVGCSRTTPAPQTGAGPESPSNTNTSSASAGDLVVSGPYVHEHLAVYLVRRPGAPRSPVEFLTLEEAMKSGAVKVYEKKQGAQVNELEIENTSDRPCYVQAGDVVKGGQQDRAIGADFIIPPRSGRKPLPSFCVEHSRWHGARQFDSSTTATYAKCMKLAVQDKKDQGQVWDEVAKEKAQQRAVNGLEGAKSSSMNEELEDPKIKARVEDFVTDITRQLQGQSDGVGLIYAINGVWSTADVYAYPELFAKLLPKLLRGAAQEAVGTKAEKRSAPTAADAQAFMTRSEDGKKTDEKSGQGTTATRIENDESVRFECRWNGARLHAESIKK